jgi:serine/threonine protein kinase
MAVRSQHKYGVAAHRDIKPENLMLMKDLATCSAYYGIWTCTQYMYGCMHILGVLALLHVTYSE